MVKKFKGSEFIPKRAKIMGVGGVELEIPNHSGIATHPEALHNFLKLDGSNANTTLDIGLNDFKCNSLTTLNNIFNNKLIASAIDGKWTLEGQGATTNNLGFTLGVGTNIDLSSTTALTMSISGMDLNLNADNQKLTMGADSSTDYYQEFDGTNTQFYTSGDFIFNNGDVGIGTTTPLSNLDIYNPASIGNQALRISRGTKILGLGVIAPGSLYGVGFTFDESTGNTYRVRFMSNDGTAFGSYSRGSTEPPTDGIIVSGNVGIGTTTPTQPLSVKEKICMTAIGGMAIKITNKTGANSVAGNLVQADTANNDAVSLSPAGNVDTIGVFLEGGIADGSEAWVVISGIADVALDDNVAAVRGYWMGAGVLAGYAATRISPPAAPTHFEEIGHCIESVAAGGAGTHILARCVLHFN